jgi:hypothetical protein
MPESARQLRRAPATEAPVLTSRGCLLMAAGLLLALPVALGAQEGQAFEPVCPFPYADIAAEHPIDANCGIEGKSASDDANHAQNRAKNNFCAEGDPVAVTPADLVGLQAAVVAAGIPFGSTKKLPADRKALQNLFTTSGGATIGEGTKVRLVAFVLKAHYSDVGTGEAVNCGENGNEPNDIHIPTVQDMSDGECASITAEMSPHSRPPGWTPKALTTPGVPMRFTGQLFFDGSHKPCTAGKGNPKRVSSWEIHPVYAVDVCTAATLAECPVADDSKWHPLVPAPGAPGSPPAAAGPG